MEKLKSEEVFLYHHGILGQKWGKKNGPPYPLNSTGRSELEKRLNGLKKSNSSNKKTNSSTNNSFKKSPSSSRGGSGGGSQKTSAPKGWIKDFREKWMQH